RAQPVRVQGSRARPDGRVSLPVVLHRAGLDRLSAGDAWRGGGDGDRLAAERPGPAARCHADADAEVKLADGLADDGGYGLAEGEEGDREPGRCGNLRYRGDAAALLAQRVADAHTRLS